MSNNFNIHDRTVGDGHPTYFVADIGANHDGDLGRAIDLINLAKEAGCDAAKFQHFSASTIVSDYGFKNLEGVITHQNSWKKSVYEVYEGASISLSWTQKLKAECARLGIEFFTSPYSPDLLEMVDPYVSVHKIGSGDITWLEMVEKIARCGKPTLLAAGASNILEVAEAVETFLSHNHQLCLMQCNTNYTGDIENFKFINLNVISSFRGMFPDVVLGLSDHTPGYATVLGAVALGARVIEKHFTDDKARTGPDHHFAMNPNEWKDMINATRELELALGKQFKKVEPNEVSSSIVQRRSIRALNKIEKGSLIKRDDLIPLRPCPSDAYPLSKIQDLKGKKALRAIPAGDYLKLTDFE